MRAVGVCTRVVAILAVIFFGSGTAAIGQAATLNAALVSGDPGTRGEAAESRPDQGGQAGPHGAVDEIGCGPAEAGNVAVPSTRSAVEPEEVKAAAGFDYDYRSDFARLPPVEAILYAYDSPSISVDPAGNLGRVLRVSPDLGLDRVAPRAAGDFVDLASSSRRTHILQGDATGGGHLWPGAAGKTPFPQSWSGNRIMHEISDIATDPAAWRNAVPQGSRTVLTGTRGGVDIRVVVDSRTGEIITGYPTNLPRNP